MKEIKISHEVFCVSELNVDNWNDNCEVKSEAKSPRPLRGLQVDISLTRNVSYAIKVTVDLRGVFWGKQYRFS